MVGSTIFFREGYRKRRRCSRDTYPESYITKYTSKRRSANPNEAELETRMSGSLGERKGGLGRFRGGLVFKAHRLLYHSTLGNTEEEEGWGEDCRRSVEPFHHYQRSDLCAARSCCKIRVACPGGCHKTILTLSTRRRLGR